MMIKRVYFGNWLRDYSQAVDTGSLKGVNAQTIRILVCFLLMTVIRQNAKAESLGLGSEFLVIRLCYGGIRSH